MIILNTPSLEKSYKDLKRSHLNPPQMLHQLMRSNDTTVVSARALGKTLGITALELADWAEAMPRGVSRLACYTYEGLKMNVLPGVIQGWEEILGYEEGVHFWVEQAIPARFKVDKPYRKPKGDVKYMIHWWNGHVILLSSMDRAINNGGEFDAIAFEEVKFMKKHPVDEIILGKRGNASRFGHLSQFGAVLKVTDRPEPQDPGRWILEDASKVTQEVNKNILQVAFAISQVNADIEAAALKKNHAALMKLNQKLSRYLKYLNELRKHSVNYIEASTLENVHALGIKTILDYYKNLDPYKFTMSVLGKDPGIMPNGFYGRLSKETHGYRSINYSYIDNLPIKRKADIKRNMNWDNDCNSDMPLQIAFDHNAVINNVVTGQVLNKTGYLQSHLYVESPKYLKDLMDRWLEYYADHKGKYVKYYYNHTSIKDDSRGNPSEHTTVINLLRAADWTVEAIDLGRTPEHRITYSLWNMSLQGEHPELLPVQINLQACEMLVKAMGKTGVIRAGKTFKKDKRTENKDPRTGKYPVPPAEAPHATEAADTLLLGMQREHYNGDVSSLISSFG